VYPPRQQFVYAVVAEPDAFILYKAYANNGTVRLAEFKTRIEVKDFLVDLSAGARRVWL
jgi:hypothetical protein